MLPITRKISKYNFYKGNEPKYIVIHYTGNAKILPTIMLSISMVEIEMLRLIIL